MHQVTQSDLDGEFMPGRRRRKFTKEDAIYGLWAEHDSDDERGYETKFAVSIEHNCVLNLHVRG